MTGGAGTGPDPKRDMMLTAATGDGRDPAMLDTTDVRDAIDLLRHVIASTIQASDAACGYAGPLERMLRGLDLMPPGGFADVPSMLSRLACDMEDGGRTKPSWARRPARGILPGATLRITVGYIAYVPGSVQTDDAHVLVEAMALASCRGLVYLDHATMDDAVSIGTGRMLKPKSDPNTLLSLSSCPLGRRLMDTNAAIDRAHALAMAETAADPSTPPCGTGRARLCARMIIRTMGEIGLDGLLVGDDWNDATIGEDVGTVRRRMERRAASNVRAEVCADVFRAMAWLYGPGMRRAFHDLDVNGQNGMTFLCNEAGGDGLERWLAEDMGCPAPFASEDALARGIVKLRTW